MQNSKILVVDDQYPVRTLMVRALTHAGYTVDSVGNGNDALAMIETSPDIALVITDLVMPEMDGLTLLKTVRKLRPSIECILVTAHGTLESAVSALKDGAHDYLLKPFNIQTLVRSVEHTLEFRRLKQEKAALVSTLEQQVNIRSAIVKAGQEITSALNQYDVLQTLLKSTLTIMPHIEQVGIFYQRFSQDALTFIGLNQAGDKTSIPWVDDTLAIDYITQTETIYNPQWLSATDSDAKTLLAEPLNSPGLLKGTLLIIGNKEDAFPESYRQALPMLTSQANIALQNARSYEEARRIDELGALVEAGQAINLTLNLRETLRTTLTVTRNLTNTHVSTIYLYTAEQRHIDSVITLGQDLQLTDADRKRAGDIARQTVDDDDPHMESAPFSDDFSDDCLIHAWLAVPLATSTAPLGVLILGSKNAHSFTEDDPRLVQVIASQAASAIENARLYEEVERRLQQAQVIDAITHSISTTLDLPSVLRLIVQSAVKTISTATNSTVHLLVPNKGIKLEAQAAELPDEINETRAKVVQQSIETLSSVQYQWQSDNERHTQWSFLSIPLQVLDSTIGAITVESPHPTGFTANDEKLLSTFAGHASVAIQNANLFRDLTSAYIDLKHHQDEIIHTNQTLRALFNGITDDLYIIDDTLTIVAINQSAANRLAQTPEALIGQHCDQKIWSNASEIISQIIKDTLQNEKTVLWESASHTYLDWVSANRGPFSERDVRTYPIYNKQGNVHQVILLAQDVSEKHRLQATLFRSANLAAVGQLASGIAHEINNPLTVVLANTQLLQMDALPDDPNADLVEYIFDAGQRIQHIVQNLLDFSTQDSYEWSEVAVEDTIDNALTLTVAGLRKGKIKVIKHLDALPTIIASANHLQLIWMNLVQNARESIIQTDRKGEIEIRATHPSPDTVQIQIIDNGIGILPEHQARLFHPFFTTKPPQQGPGLGLYSCRTIVEHHQGSIELAPNKEGHGAIATVTLPIDASPT